MDHVSPEDRELITTSELFDADWYATRVQRSKMPEGVDFVTHFLTIGGRNGVAASRKFVTAAYLAMNADVARSGMNPLVHYLKSGAAEGRIAVELDRLAEAGFPEMTRREEHRAVANVAASLLFDGAYLVSRYPDIAAQRTNPVLHYVRQGLADLLDPSAAFDAAAYALENPDVEARKVAPLLHYIRFGEPAGVRIAAVDDPAARAVGLERATAPDGWPYAPGTVAGVASGAVDPAGARRAAKTDDGLTPVERVAMQRIRESPLFDPSWYMMENLEVARLAMDPILHYLRHGAAAGRNPGPYFDAKFYAAGDPAAEQNALMHYLTIGRSEGRAPRPRLALEQPIRSVAADA